MRFFVLALALVSCNIPTREDVKEATAEATELCREFVNDFVTNELPNLVDEVIDSATAAAFAAFTLLNGQGQMTQDLVKEARELIVYDVLVGMGCNHNSSSSGMEWDCRSDTLICVRQ